MQICSLCQVYSPAVHAIAATVSWVGFNLALYTAYISNLRVLQWAIVRRVAREQTWRELPLKFYSFSSGPCRTSERESPAVCRNMRKTIKSAKDFMASDAFKTISNDRVTVNGDRERLSIFCSTSERECSLM